MFHIEIGEKYIQIQYILLLPELAKLIKMEQKV